MQSAVNSIYERPRRRWKVSHVVVGLLVVAAGCYWLLQMMRKGAKFADPSGVTTVTYSRPADGEKEVLPNTFVSVYLSAGHSVDPASLNVSTVRLYRTSDNKAVPAQCNTSAAGDDIVLTPLAMLDPQTKYTFEIRGVKDTTGADLMPYTMSFTTSGGARTEAFPVAFDKLDLPSESARYTCLDMGPDGKLYASTVDGRIMRREILPDGTLGTAQVISSLVKANNGPRLITGICFDPKSTADNLVLWISHGQLVMSKSGDVAMAGASEWTGKISTLSGTDLSNYRDVVVDLPRSFGNHLNNQPNFGPDGCLYFSQGSHTAMGAPDKKWGGNRVERLLSAAVLRLDPSKVPSPQTLDVKTVDGGGAYDPLAAEAPLTIYASGVRVGYDMLWHSNGHLYTATNGSAAGGNTPGTPNGSAIPRRIDQAERGLYTGPEVIGLKNVTETEPDAFLKLERGGYYGHPNPTRGEYVLNGGNPTGAKDPFEVAAYPVGTLPDRNWRHPNYDFGTSVSPNGMLEYRSDGKLFGGALDGKVLITRFSGGKDIIVLSLDKNGDVTETITGIAGLTSFTDPLDLTEDPRSGCIYVAEYGGEKLALLRPVTDAARLAQLRQNIFRQQVHASIAE